MEILQFEFNGRSAKPLGGASISGVVGSGNLEILIRANTEPEVCVVTVKTSARGFSQIWQAVLDEFCSHHPVGGTLIDINDMGATPAVVTLRLGQAISEYTGGAR